MQILLGLLLILSMTIPSFGGRFFTTNTSCPATNLQNISKYPWEEYDFNAIEVAKSLCSQKSQIRPCLVLFWKIGLHNYKPVCGYMKPKWN